MVKKGKTCFLCFSPLILDVFPVIIFQKSKEKGARSSGIFLSSVDINDSWLKYLFILFCLFSDSGGNCITQG